MNQYRERILLSARTRLVYPIVFFVLGLHCSWIQIADPNFRKKPLEMEDYSGFIARDFFQIVVKVDATARDIPIRDRREDCKRRSIPLRNRMTIPLLLQESKDNENDRLRGINRIQKSYPSPDSATNTGGSAFDPSGSSLPIITPLFPSSKMPKKSASTSPNAGPNSSNSQSQNSSQKDKDEDENTFSLFGERETHGDLLFDPKMVYLQGEFAWFLDSYKLYKEDYTNPKKCVFVYRIAKKGLYEKLENTKVSIDWEDYEL